MSLWRYRIYGLTMEADREIPGLAGADRGTAADVHLTFDVPLQSREAHAPWAQRSGVEVWRTGSPERFHFRYSDGTDFLISRRNHIAAAWLPSSSFEDTVAYLVGPIFGFLLRIHGILCLHACAIAVGNKAILVSGRHRAGKSTLAASFADAGFPILSDDVVAIRPHRSGHLACPGYPLLRLWPDAVKYLSNSSELPRITPTWDKRKLDLMNPPYRFQSTPLPIAAVYLIQDGEGEIRAEDVGGVGRLMNLAANTYANELLDTDLRRSEFQQLARFAPSVPVRSLVRDIRDFLLDDIRSQSRVNN
jgi:hypothetical protein